MTKLTITRERLVQLADENTICKVSWDERIELAHIALAAMDREPVAFTDERNLHHIALGRETSLIWGKQNSEAGDIALYRHAQPVPVVPEDVLRDAKRWRALLGSARIRILGSAGFDATAHPGENPDYRHFGMEIWTHYPNWLHEKNEYGIDTLTQYADACRAAMPASALQPAPEVSDE